MKQTTTSLMTHVLTRSHEQYKYYGYSTKARFSLNNKNKVMRKNLACDENLSTDIFDFIISCQCINSFFTWSPVNFLGFLLVVNPFHDV
ncbi:hypothetical protein KFK09_002325 [Dendrobium nobile]|uniref:Uncharacterized protein n=1 Tax=Dendrobium nobile TaxID=94219 RepID=A0A8T3CA01_DENNO|nr:hypothetical protein KFK09_002325 [Dendrobium nobile]